MTEITILEAEAKTATGTGGARAIRRAGRVPAIIYGGGDAPVMITLEDRVLKRQLNQPGFYSQLYDIKIGGQTQRVIPRDVQKHPVTDWAMHVDFLRVSAESKIEVAVPVVFENEEESPGLRRGGLLNIVRHEVDLICAASDIPQSIAVDLKGLDIGDSVHISHVRLPANVTPTITDRDFTIATIAAPTVQREEAAEEEAAEAAAPAAEEEAEGEEGGAEENEE